MFCLGEYAIDTWLMCSLELVVNASRIISALLSLLVLHYSCWTCNLLCQQPLLLLDRDKVTHASTRYRLWLWLMNWWSLFYFERMCCTRHGPLSLQVRLPLTIGLDCDIRADQHIWHQTPGVSFFVQICLALSSSSTLLISRQREQMQCLFAPAVYFIIATVWLGTLSRTMYRAYLTADSLYGAWLHVFTIELITAFWVGYTNSVFGKQIVSRVSCILVHC